MVSHTGLACHQVLLWALFAGLEVLIEEVDEGQPCLVCHGRCPGFQPHAWRHTCRQCKCPRRQHDVYNANNSVNVFDRLGWQRPEGEDDGLLQGYTWVPAGLTSNEISDYMQQLPKDKVPRVGGPGERYRDRQLIGQLPRQDMSDTYCRSLLDPQEIKEFRIFRELRDQVAMDVGTVAKAPADATCCHCRSEICRGNLVIRASKVSEGSGSGSFWHPGCFVCCTCNELLVDLVYCLHHQELYCERHYAQTKRPRCPGCDELIFSGEFTRAMEETFHKEHLACFKCEKKLIACRYIAKEEHPYCVPCYQELFAHSCETCSKPIGPDYKDLSYKERHWHEFCFKCSQCENSLVNQPFAPKDENIFCSECYDNNFAARCDACNNPFRGGMKKFEYKGNKWHEECFTCGDCQQPIGNKSFIPREERVICLSCYEANYAQKCNKCTEVINKGGISYKNSPFHRECFTCTNCSKTLAGEKFTSREEQPYCGDCFGELFAKKCIRCTKPITGIGGTKFISFEERHWHSDCFVCYRCEASMVGRGFLMQGEEILCPDCGRS